ncbi:MAG: TonB-dependent receptor plug domain-containing protein [Opitutaceae bacterium]
MNTPTVWVAAGLLAAVAPLRSQTASPALKETKPEETISLSPFEVNATEEAGYVGQDTLSGSRLRTNLKDVAAAISPMTAEFLRDIAATNIVEAVEYGVGTRVETDDARAAGPVGDGYNDGFRSIRIRGLPGGGRSINFFGAPGEVDLYMTDRIEVSRGPNSILYGFGSPAGKINVSTKQAMTNKNVTSLSARIDSWEGQRWTADHNTVLIKNKLALRAVVLHGRERSWRAAGYNDQDRIFLAGKWQIDRRTTLKVEYEHGEISRFVPRPFFANDLSSTWEASNRPIFNNFSATYTPGGPFTPGAAGTPGTPIRDTGSTNVVGVQERSGGDWVVVSDRFSAAQNYRQFTYSESPTGGLLANDFARGRSNPEAVLEANWVRGQFRVNNGSAFFQRELLRDLNLEVGYNRQTSRGDTHNLASWNHYGVAADTNRYLPNGQLKPAGNLYYFDLSPDHRPSSSQVNQGRVTLSYEKGYRDWVNLRVAGLGEMAETKSRSEILQQYWLKGPQLTSGGAFNPTPENGANTVYYRYYLNDLSQLDDPNFRIPAPYTLSGATKYQDPRTGAISDIYMQEFNRAQGNIGYVDRETRAYMGVAQAFLLKNRAVLTYGYRKDRLKNWVGVAVRDPAAEAIAPNTGVWTPVDPRTATGTVFTGQTRTLGGVVHFTPWISGFYNMSNSLSTPGTNYITPSDPRKTTIADLVPSPSGETTDYGVKLTLLKNRIFVTATQFHTISKDEFGFSGFNKGNVVNIWNALANSGGLSADETNFARRQAEVMNQVQGYTQDSESKGLEFEVVGQIVPGWSVSINYSKNKTMRSNMAREYRAYIDFHKDYWKKFSTYSITQNANTPGVDLAPGSQDWNSAATIATTGDFTINTDSVNEAIADAEAAFFDNPYVFEGKRFVGDPLHNLNLRTRYDFRAGRLKGLTVGVGTRLRQGRVAGARSEYTFASGTDYTSTWNGRVVSSVSTVNASDQNVYDLQVGYQLQVMKRKVRWNIQLNVNNVLDQDELIVNNVHPRTLVPITYRYQDPRQIILTNTFTF